MARQECHLIIDARWGGAAVNSVACSERSVASGVRNESVGLPW